MSTKETYYMKPVSPKLTWDEIEKLLSDIAESETYEVTHDKHVAQDLKFYESMWRESHLAEA